MYRAGFGSSAIATAIVMWVAMLVFLEIGRQLGLRQITTKGREARTGVGVVDGAVYSLAALLLGFSFSGAAARFDQRRELIIKQVSAVTTAIQRTELVSPAQAPVLRRLLAEYLRVVLSTNQRFTSASAALHQPPEVAHAEEALWTQAVEFCRTPPSDQVRVLLLPSFNEMFDAVENERLARWVHPPTIILVMLAATTLAAAVFAGYGLASTPTRNWIYIIGFTATIAAAIYVIVELEYPRLGIVNIASMDQALRAVSSTLQLLGSGPFRFVPRLFFRPRPLP